MDKTELTQKLSTFEERLKTDPNFRELQLYLNKPNIFEVLKSTGTEIRHSNVIAWLMDPHGSHYLGDIFLRYILEIASDKADKLENSEKSKAVSVEKINDLSSFQIRREWKNIDIMAISEREKLILCIENKIRTVDHSHQLSRYRKILDTDYPEYKKLYVYLTPNGDKPTEKGEEKFWVLMSYAEDIIPGIEDIYEENVDRLGINQRVLIDNYCKSTRRHIMGDEKLIELCEKIYYTYKSELDTIFENKPDKRVNVIDSAKKWLENADRNIIHNDKSDSPYRLRFRCETMSDILKSGDDEDYWKKRQHMDGNNYYAYEIAAENKNEDVLLKFEFVIGSYNLPSKMLTLVNKLVDETMPGEKNAMISKPGSKFVDPQKEVFIRNSYTITLPTSDDDANIDKMIKVWLDKIWNYFRNYENKVAEIIKQL